MYLRPGPGTRVFKLGDTPRHPKRRRRGGRQLGVTVAFANVGGGDEIPSATVMAASSVLVGLPASGVGSARSNSDF